MTEYKKNILIYRLGSLGDTVIALPCFHQIKKSFPDSHITLLTNRPVMSKAAPLEAVLGTQNFFHNIISYPVGTRNPAVLLRLNREIRSLNIDTVINITALRSPNADKRDRLFFQLAGVTNFIGFDHVDSDYTVQVDESTGHYEWEAKRLTKKITALGPIDLSNSDYWDLKISDAELQAADQAIGIHVHSQFIVMNAGTKMEVKNWGAENWLSLIDKISYDYSDFPLVVIGVEEESELADKLLDKWKGPGINLCGKTSPRVSAVILGKSKLFIGHDSGPMHLAACMGTPCVGVFSCINRPRQWFPRGENNRIIMPRTDCAKNDIKGCVNEDQFCILSTTVDAVASEIGRVMDQISVV